MYRLDMRNLKLSMLTMDTQVKQSMFVSLSIASEALNLIRYSYLDLYSLITAAKVLVDVPKEFLRHSQ